MTPENPDPDRVEEELSPENEATVRRLLAAAAAPMTMPGDVAGRLDEVIAGLQAERNRDGATPAADLSELGRRRERRWPKVLVAAAMVGVVGVGIGNVLSDTGGDSAEDATSAGAAADEDHAEAAPQPESGGDLLRTDGAPKTARDLQSSAALLGADLSTPALPLVRAGSVEADAQRVYELSSRRDAPFNTARGGMQTDAMSTVCKLPPIARGERLVAVRLAGERATLLFRSEQDQHRRAEVYTCDDGDSPVLVTTVEAR